MPSSCEPLAFEIAASTGAYSVEIGPDLLARLVAEPGERVFIVDAVLAGRLLWLGVDPIIVVAEEPAKALDRMTDIIVAMRERRVTRGTTLIAVGGGVVQDIAAFAATIYMRGLDWVYVPTTLLSMTDSCIGGKSSINVGPYKNICGTFHPPKRVLVDPSLTATLSAEQMAGGLMEAAKICFCRGVYDRYAAFAPSVTMAPDALQDVITLSLTSKKWFIEIDEFDRGERLVLNLGHTFGHAIEAASRFAVGHGIAVGLGMLAAIELGRMLGRAGPSLAFVAHVEYLLDAAGVLPKALKDVTIPALIDAFRSDKKHAADRFAVILVGGGDRVERVFLPRDDATIAHIEGAFAAILARWSGTARVSIAA